MTGVRHLLRSLILFVAFTILAGISPVAAQNPQETTDLRPDVPQYAMRGPHAVGYRALQVEDTNITRLASIWYPAILPDDVSDDIIYDIGVGDIMPPIFNRIAGHAYPNALPLVDDGPYPLIVYSHGYGGPFMLSAYQLETLASYGFVVYAFDHSTDSLRAGAIVSTEEEIAVMVEDSMDSMIMRLLDITVALDTVEILNSDDETLAGLVDMEHVGVQGLSLGGYTALMQAGIRFEFSDAEAVCENENITSPVTGFICESYGDNFTAFEQRMAELAGVEITPRELWDSLADPRVDSVVGISPAGVMSFIGDAGLAAADKPLMILYGTLDPIAHDTIHVYEQVSSETSALVLFENAGHLFGIQCTEGMWQYYTPCYDPVWDKQRSNDLTNHFITAFFLATLKDDMEAAAVLSPDAVNFPGITYEAKGF